MANGSYNPTTLQERPSSNNNSMVSRSCFLKNSKVTGILHIVAGIICIVFGIVAIILKAFASYIALPIWMGPLVFIITGILGVLHFRKPQKKGIVVSYVAMSIISAVLSFFMMVAFAILTWLEKLDDRWWWLGYTCHPLSRVVCDIPFWPRLLVDGLLILIYFLEMVGGITSASLVCSKEFQCCRQYNGPGNSTVVYYAANMGGGQMMAVPNNQCQQPIYIAGGVSGTADQPAQMMYLAPSPQPQTFVQLPVGTPLNQPIPLLTPPPPPLEQQPVLQQKAGVVQQSEGIDQEPSGLATGQGGYVQPQGPGQMPSQPTEDSKAPLMEPAGMSEQPGVVQQGVVQQPSGLATGQAGFVQVPGQMQHQIQGLQMQPQVLAAAQGQVSFIQVQAPRGQIQTIPAYP